MVFSPQGLSRQVSLLYGSVVSLGWKDTYTSSQTSEIDFPCLTFILAWIAPWFTNFILSRPKERILQAPAVFTSAWKEPHTSKKLLVKVFPFFFWHWDANWSCCSQLNQHVLIVGSVARTDQQHTHNSAGRREKTRFYRACTRQLRTQFARLGLKINYIPEIDQRPKSYENLKWNRPLFALWPRMRKTKLRNKRADRIPAPNKSLLGMSWGYRKNQPEFRKHARTSSGLSEYPPFGEHTQTLEPNPSSYPHDKTKNHTARYIQDMIGLPPMSKVASMKEKTETHFEN